MYQGLDKYFLPYQKQWLADQSRFKIWEKSRRIGATYVQSFEDVRYCVEQPRRRVYFSSADESAAKEYIDYGSRWCEIFNIVAEQFGTIIVDIERDISATAIKFKNDSRIYAMSSSPRRFRSKGGKIVLDEFAWHDNQDLLWAAARPCIQWGAPLRVLSTYNGASNLYAKFIEDVKLKKLSWNLHTTPITDAVASGLADRITGRDLTDSERADWVDEERKNCKDESIWQQEYCCVPMDETTAFLPYELICSREQDYDIGDLSGVSGDLYVGMDIGRIHDLTVIWSIEKIGNTKITRSIDIMQNAPFNAQREKLFSILSHRKLARACIDASGIGMQLSEEAVQAFGEYRVEPVTFTSRVKEELAFGARRAFESGDFVIPSMMDVREDLHKVRRVHTAAGNIRFDAARDDRGHADRFWGMALALHAATGAEYTPLTVASSRGYTLPGLVSSY